MSDQTGTEETGGPASEIEAEVRGLFRQGQYAEAVPILRAHLESEPEDAAAYELMSDALRFAGDKAGAAGALALAADVYAKRGEVIQSIACQKKQMKFGVEPDFSKVRVAAAEGGASRVPTPLFDDLEDAEFEEVAEVLESRSFAAGATVVREGDPADAMYVIARGTMDITVRGPDGEVHLATLGPGEFFGESALLSGKPRTATARAGSECECLVLAKDDFDMLTARFPRTLEVVEEFNRKRAAATVETLVKKKS